MSEVVSIAVRMPPPALPTGRRTLLSARTVPTLSIGAPADVMCFWVKVSVIDKAQPDSVNTVEKLL